MNSIKCNLIYNASFKSILTNVCICKLDLSHIYVVKLKSTAAHPYEIIQNRRD